MKVLLSTAYWPNLHYFFYLLNSDQAFIEQYAHYPKQSFANRTRVLSANGVLDLSIPIEKKQPKELVKELCISYREKWQARHWGALYSAYKNSPYFDYFEEEIHFFYTREFPLLLDYNLLQLQLILKLLKQKKEIILTTEFLKNPEDLEDLRESIHPKLDLKQDARAKELLLRPYYQTFGYKLPFQPNLSILDLLFNTGLGSNGYLIP